VTILTGASGTGSGSVGFTAAGNTTSTARSATLTIAGLTFVVTEPSPSCTFTVNPVILTIPPGGGTGTITVTTTPSCAWTSSTSATWITLSGSATGSGSVTYTVPANGGITSRSALINIAGLIISVSQNAVTVPAAPVNVKVIR
jgi:hypothetical protein